MLIDQSLYKSAESVLERVTKINGCREFSKILWIRGKIHKTFTSQKLLCTATPYYSNCVQRPGHVTLDLVIGCYYAKQLLINLNYFVGTDPYVLSISCTCLFIKHCNRARATQRKQVFNQLVTIIVAILLSFRCYCSTTTCCQSKFKD